MAIIPVHSPHAGPPHGHYEQAVVAGGFVFVSGILGKSEMPDGSSRNVEEETEYCLTQLSLILDAAGAKLNDVVKLNLYVSDVAHWPLINAICARHFGAHRPARAIVSSPDLRLGSQIELDAVALACA
jgi:reactive intermediate/imine deaminase